MTLFSCLTSTECKHSKKCEESDVLQKDKAPKTELSLTCSHKQKKDSLDLEMEDPEVRSRL